MNVKSLATDLISLAFIFNFFYEGVFKLQDIQWFKLWISSMPHLERNTLLLSYTIPIFEICISFAFLFRRVRLAALYTVFWTLILYLAYLLWAFMSNVVLIGPYHVYWLKPKWIEVAVFNIVLAAFAYFGVFCIESQKKHRYKVNILRKKAALVH